MARVMEKLANLKIRGRLMLGFSTVVLLLVLAVGITTVQVDQVSNSMARVVGLRVPTANASASIINDINASLAALRGWMLTGNTAFKAERVHVWEDIVKESSKMDTLAASWTNPDNVEKWTDFKVILAEFATAQQIVEDIANSEDQYPATKMLVEQAAPKAGVIVTEITKMIDDELMLKSEADRKDFFGAMADVRGTMGLSLANIRAYLLTGDQKFIEKFNKLWAKNIRRFKDLSTHTEDMTASQKTSFEKMRKAHMAFKEFPPKMFEIRKSAKSNMANFMLVTEAAPRAGKLMTILAGKKEAKGNRTGGMVDNQRDLLTMDATQSERQIVDLQIIQFVILVVGLIVAGFAVVLTARSIVPPIQQLGRIMGVLAEGDASLDVPSLNRADEIGEMAQTVQIFKDNKIKADAMAAEQEKLRLEMQAAEEKKRQDEAALIKAEAVQVAERDARARRVTELTASFDESVSGILADVSNSLSGLENTAQDLSKTAENSSVQAGTVAAASEQAANNVQTVAAATEELSSSISGLTDRVTQSEKIATSAVEEAEKTNGKISQLNISAQKVNEVVNLISDIAEQTNLLALNATIEAARAGDAGKGFAVVAAEVKNLATQTARATEEITNQISAMQSDTSGAVEAVKGISQTIDGINEITNSISSAIDEQSSATMEISRNIQEATLGNQEVATHIVDVSKASTDTSEASGQVLSVAVEVKQKSDTLTRLVETFLADIRVA